MGFLLWTFGRLVRIEAALVENTKSTDKVALHVAAQNGRISKLEHWQWQIVGAGLLVLGLGPVVFWALGFITHG